MDQESLTELELPKLSLPELLGIGTMAHSSLQPQRLVLCSYTGREEGRAKNTGLTSTRPASELCQQLYCVPPM